jgi:TRAP-type C4-dicarboxylate transport system substrate-binding protein
MQLFSIPYVFRDRDHFFKVLDSEIGKELLESTEVARLRGLGYYDAGSRSFYTTDKLVCGPQGTQDPRAEEPDFCTHGRGTGR